MSAFGLLTMMSLGSSWIFGSGAERKWQMYIWTYLYIGGNVGTGMDEKMGPRFHL